MSGYPMIFKTELGRVSKIMSGRGWVLVTRWALMMNWWNCGSVGKCKSTLPWILIKWSSHPGWSPLPTPTLFLWVSQGWLPGNSDGKNLFQFIFFLNRNTRKQKKYFTITIFLRQKHLEDGGNGTNMVKWETYSPPFYQMRGNWPKDAWPIEFDCPEGKIARIASSFVFY